MRSTSRKSVKVTSVSPLRVLNVTGKRKGAVIVEEGEEELSQSRVSHYSKKLKYPLIAYSTRERGESSMQQ